MDEQSKAYLQAILGKDPGVLSEEEVGFLKARREYLTGEQKRIFESVLRDNPFREAAPAADQSEPKQQPEPAVEPEQQPVVEPAAESVPDPAAEVASEPSVDSQPEAAPMVDEVAAPQPDVVPPVAPVPEPKDADKFMGYDPEGRAVYVDHKGTPYFGQPPQVESK